MMHKKLRHIQSAAIALLLGCMTCQTLISQAAQETAVDTITLDTDDSSETDVSVDMKWKTRKEGGKWVETLGVAQGVDSLLLIINDEDAGIPECPQTDGSNTSAGRIKKRDMIGNSRLLYFAKDSDGSWTEIFMTGCYLSGGANIKTEDLYGVYRASGSFGNGENPGSLVPFEKLTEKDYWMLNPDSEYYGTIYRAQVRIPEEGQAVNLEGLKAYSNYGMIFRPWDESETYPALLVNCQQADTVETMIGGIQMPQSYVRMLIQSVDSETKIAIAKDVESLEKLQ